MNKLNLILLSSMLLMIEVGQSAEFNTNELIVKSGHKNKLADDEGYLLVSVQALGRVDRIAIKSTESFSRKIWIKGAKSGSNLALIKLKAGTYQLERFRSGIGYYGFTGIFGDHANQFEVKSGVVNYPGTWFIEYEKLEAYTYRFSAKLHNLLSQIYPRFITTYQSRVAAAPFKYTGPLNDPYIEFLNANVKEDKQLQFSDLMSDINPESNGAIKVSTNSNKTNNYQEMFPDIGQYLAESTQISGGVNQDGQFFLFATKINGETIIAIADINKYEIDIIYKEVINKDSQLSELQWVDDDTIHYEFKYLHKSENHVAHLIFDESEQLQQVKHMQLPLDGKVISPLLTQPNQLFYATYKGGNPTKPLKLYLVDVKNKRTIRKSFWKPHTTTKELENAIEYLIDENDIIRAAVTLTIDEQGENRVFEYWFFDRNYQWKKIKSFQQQQKPLALHQVSNDESFFYVITDQHSDKSAIHKYSTADLSHLGLFFEDEDHDITGLIFDDQDQSLIGYRYTESGFIKMKYFNSHDDRLTELHAVVKDMSLYVSESIKQSDQLLIYGVGPTKKGAWFVYDPQKRNLAKLIDSNPDYEALPKGQFHHIKTEVDGFSIEGYLVTPQANEKTYPLVVLPHGGPIGVRDYAYNDAVQHFFATQGIATLKVNYRGSSGYGNEFENAGKQQWGKSIEKDIHAVVLDVIDQFPIARNKICSMGGSYGGYSAVMLSILYPDHYQCAVSWAGVMDLPLLFSDKKFSDNVVAKKMVEIIGDPETSMNELVQKSPVYLADKITKPLLLLQGMKDSQVVFEHAMRMHQSALFNDLDVALVLFPEEGHSFSSTDVKIQHVGMSLEFIKNKLKLP